MEDATATKTCTKCRESKLLGEFYPRQGYPGRRTSGCKDCIRARRRRYGKANRARETAATRARRGQDPEAFRQYMAEWRASNGEKILAQQRAWSTANADHLRALKQKNYYDRADWYRSWRARNPEQARANSRAYALANQDARREQQARRRARQTGSAEAFDMADLWTGICSICHEPLDAELKYPDPLSKSIDHVIPLARGGRHVRDNCAWSHLRCNVRKGARLLGPPAQ